MIGPELPFKNSNRCSKTIPTKGEIMRCSACATPYHEASGHRHSERTQLCGACAREWLRWLKGNLSRRWGGLRFYEHLGNPRYWDWQANILASMGCQSA
jgi:hypothetical protein